MKVYDTKMAPNPRRVRMFLAEKNALDQVELVQMDLGKGDNLSKEFRAKNPMGKVPALELDDGTMICESVSICRYLDEVLPGGDALFGRDPLERAMIDMWERRMDLSFMYTVGNAFRHTSGFFSDRETVVAEWGQVNVENAGKMFIFIDRHLANSQYIAGEHFSIADITAVCAVDFAKTIGIKVSDEYPNLKRWHEQMTQRPSYAA